jgi:hypothetical protein
MALSAGCRVRVVGGIDVGTDGHGTVRAAVGLDDDAVKEVGDLAATLRVDDLRAAGWKVDGPRKEGDGLTWVRATRSFSGVAGATEALSQLSGADGPFRAMTLRRTRTLLHSRTTLSGTVDLSDGLAGFADSDLRSKVGGDLPLDVAGLRARFGDDLDRIFEVRFEARLPGSATSNATGHEGDRLVWRPLIGSRVPVQAGSSDLNQVTVVALAAVVLVAAGAGTAWFLVRRRRRTAGR